MAGRVPKRDWSSDVYSSDLLPSRAFSFVSRARTGEQGSRPRRREEAPHSRQSVRVGRRRPIRSEAVRAGVGTSRRRAGRAVRQMIFLDTSAIYAWSDVGDRNHRTAIRYLQAILDRGEDLL